MADLMEINLPDWPRLSGILWYGPPRSWELIHTKDAIEIIPAKTPYGLLIYFVSLGIAAVVGTQVVLSQLPSFPDKGWVLAWSVGMAVAFVLFCVLIRSRYVKEQSRGAIVIVSFVRREVSFPREGKAWPFDRIVHWEIVHGFMGRSEHGKARTLAAVISELQMVVKDDNDRKSAWPIIGALGRNDRALYATANEIATKMEVPVVITKDKKRYTK